MAKPIIALMYDFDKTLSPRNMQEYGFMDGLDMTAEEFWTECAAITKQHNMDSILAYMYLMLEKGKSGLVLRRETFNELGRTVKLFPGVESWFCGFFPAEKPKYVIAVLKEDGRSGSADCAPVFKAIADGIMKLK